LIFAHPRVGAERQTFRCLKFRRMVNHGDRVAGRDLERIRHARWNGAETRKLRTILASPPLGRFAGKSSLDELPQLINVLALADELRVGPAPSSGRASTDMDLNVGCTFAPSGTYGICAGQRRSLLEAIEYRRGARLASMCADGRSADCCPGGLTIPACSLSEQAKDRSRSWKSLRL